MGAALPALAILALLATACGNAMTPTLGETGCEEGTAVVRVGDGFLQQLCGCDEDDDSVVMAGDPFTCTISSGETVVFFYRGGRRPHRVVSTGMNTFPAGFLYDPENEQSVDVYPVVFDQAGTFSFEDQFQPDLTGDIVVL